MNRATTTRWKRHFFPLGVVFLMVGAAGLLQTAALVSSLSYWRCGLLGGVAVLFFVLQASGIGQAWEAMWLWLILIWVSAGILRIGGLNLFQLYPLLMAALGCSLLLRHTKSRVLGDSGIGASHE